MTTGYLLMRSQLRRNPPDGAGRLALGGLRRCAANPPYKSWLRYAQRAMPGAPNKKGGPRAA